MRFPGAIRTLAVGGTINAAVLHYMAFRNDTQRVWQGFGDLVTVDGRTWKGIGDVVSIEGGGQQVGMVANNMTLKLAGTSDLISDDLTAKALASATAVYGRRYFQAIQFMTANWQPIDDYFTVYVGVMDRMTFRRVGADLREISLNIESPFVRRRIPQLDIFSDTAQKSKYPNDRLLEFISGLANKTVSWPKY